MENRVAVVGIIVESPAAVEPLNRLLHDYSGAIIGRMGIPHRARGLNIISVVMDAPQREISALSGKLGQIPGLSVKVVYSKAEVSG